ncbi:UTP--glucose-1-phosphate uridylyltransferase [Spartobacteria bacterium LR76]|nr:UTP--glucose-1-phosphate uridylyltransferase [Spartobacteria bacterium LR76]
MSASFDPFRQKMESAGLSKAAIAAFERSYGLLAANESGLIPESAITPAEGLPLYEEVATTQASPDLLAKTVLLKLNGGLGTGMGLEKAKSLLPVRDGQTFLDLIVRQVLAARKATGSDLKFLLLNSFSTSEDTLGHLAKYPELGNPADLELMQNKVPKIDAATLAPIEWPADRDHEWCPPGHGDLYPAILGSGMLQQLLDAGYRYLFVSNSDNLGATLDLGLLGWFAASGKPFVMEVTARTAADRKGGHLASRATDGQLLLRESAQCPDEDMDEFQDISKHRYFNTNNLWLRLDLLAEALDANGGLLPLPVIKNKKTVDPRDKKSPAVYQLETAMGAAIECFADAGAVVVPRMRFAPVKTTADLLALRSDAYIITEDGRAVLAPERNGIPPEINLDGDHFKMVDQLDAALAGGVPSLIRCKRLDVKGPAKFTSSDVYEGDAVVDVRS